MQTSQWLARWTGAVRTPADMLRFVDDVGCCTRQALPGFPDFPNQQAALGDPDPMSPDPWFWKDDLHIQKHLYYTRVFGGRPGFLSYTLLPAMIAANGAAADELLFNGAMSPEAREIYVAIEKLGPIPIRDLKRMLSADARRAATRVLHTLDRQFIITKTGITGRTLGSYGYVWDLVERFAPDMLDAADRLGRDAAMELIRQHLAAFGVPPGSPFYQKVLGWPR